MLRKSRLAGGVILASASLLLGTGAVIAKNVSAPETQCTAKTARQVSSPSELCSCTTITTGMIRYIQRSRDFADILAETSQLCPQLAAILSDIPTAAIDEDGDEPAGPEGNGPRSQPEPPSQGPEPEDNGCGGSCPGFD